MNYYQYVNLNKIFGGQYVKWATIEMLSSIDNYNKDIFYEPCKYNKCERI